MNITRIGVDLAKHVFQVHGVNRQGEMVVRKQLRRTQMLDWFGKLAPCLVGMEACGSAHYWARELSKLGHDARLMAAQFVKPYVKRGKNDANDAEAICEAVSRPTMRFVAAKTVEQQTMQAEHRIRARLVRSRTALSNEIRGLLSEFGVIVPTSLGALRRALPEILEDGENGLPGDFRILLAELAEELRSLDDRVKFYDTRLQTRARTDERIQRLLAVEGIGPVVASALVAAVDDGRQFGKGRDLAAWLGLTPREHSSGGKQRLGGISKQGDTYVRTLLIHGARAALNAAANKNARIAWAILARGEVYRAAA